MKRLLTALSLIVALGIAPANADSGTTFTGTCVWAGTLTFDPGLTLTPRPTRMHAGSTGTCTGTLRGGSSTAQVSNAPAQFELDTSSDGLSCLGGLIAGTATLAVGNASIDVNIAEVQLATASILRLSGRSTGTAISVATIDTRANPLSTLGCMGSGVAEVPITLVFRTLSPIG
jgi:hypothetical protein